MTGRLSQQELEAYLWGAAVILRGLVDAGDYKQTIFPLLFYKRLSDVWDEEYAAALAETPPLAQTRYQPRPQAHARYAALYPVYRLLREQMLPVWQARQAALQPLSQDLQP